MEQVLHVATSEFFWGIVIGLLLAVVVAGVNIWLDNKRRRRAVAALLQDLIESVCDLIQNLEDNRHRNNIIDREFLFSIEAELGVYTRNREALGFISDTKLRKELREFFMRVTAFIAEIRGRLSQFTDAHRSALVETDPEQRAQAEQEAGSFLQQAHKACDRLRELRSRREPFEKCLKEFSRRWF